ncbi:coiled-coil domain-containing protein 97 [Centroberyx gerrardi]
MWGEIEPPPKPQLSLCVSGDTNKAPVCRPREQRTPALGFELSRSTNTEEPRQDNQPQVVSSCVRAMVEAVALSRTQVKSQQIGDAELSLDQRTEELLQQYRSRPLVFLERYQAYLKPQHLAAFAHLSSDPRAQHYSRVIQRRTAGCTERTRVRNQRYAALRALQREGQYFSEEQMRVREPLLYEQYIGQYLTDEELLERSLEAMQGGAHGGAHGGAEGPGGGTGGLAHILLDSYQERLIQNRLQEEQEREEGAQEEDEDEDDEGVKEEGWEPSPEEKALLREEFVSQMHQRFLDGKDKDFNYSEVDGNPDYDNLDIVSRDAEEKYFDNDDEEDEVEDVQEEEEEEEERENKDEEEEEKMTE